MVKEDKEYKLNSNQIHLLKLVYKFRFVSSGLLTRYKGLSSLTTINRSLRLLHKRGYLLKRYNKSYKLAGKGAMYCLSTKGVAYLKKEQDISARVLHPQYKNKTISNEYAEHCIDVFKVYLALRDAYPNMYDVFVRSEVVGEEELPGKLPDLYMRSSESEEDILQEYLLELHNEALPFIIKKRMNYLIEFFEDEDWMNDTFPTILLVLKNAADERRLQKHISDRLEFAGMDGELTVLTTTMPALLANGQTKVWSDVLEPRVLQRLVS